MLGFVGFVGFAAVLTVKKGDAVFVVRVFGFPEDETKAKEKTLALDVLSKLAAT